MPKSMPKSMVKSMVKSMAKRFRIAPGRKVRLQDLDAADIEAFPDRDKAESCRDPHHVSTSED